MEIDTKNRRKHESVHIIRIPTKGKLKGSKWIRLMFQKIYNKFDSNKSRYKEIL